jgi:hypothetical protein
MTNKNSVIFFVEGNRMKKLTYIKEKTDKLISWKAELDVPSTLDAEFCVIFVDGFIKNEIRLTVYKNGDVDYLHK